MSKKSRILMATICIALLGIIVCLLLLGKDSKTSKNNPSSTPLPTPTNTITPTPTVTPIPIIEVADAFISENEITITVGEEIALEFGVLPNNTNEKYEMNVSVSDNTVISENDGTIKGLATGEAIVKCEIKTKRKTFASECKVRVIIPIDSIEFEKDIIEVPKGEESQIVAWAMPEDSTDEVVFAYKSADETIATVDENGLVKGISKGSTVVTISCGKVKTECVVNVTIPVTEIKLDKTDIYLNVGETATVNSVILPDDTTVERIVEYKSDNEDVVTIKGGVIKAEGPGTATITASCGGKKASCKVYVKCPLASIQTSVTNLVLMQGTSWKIGVVYNPTNTTDNKTIVWSSSDESIVNIADGTATGIASGTATITAKCGSKQAQVTVRIVDGADAELNVDVDELHFTKLGETHKLKTMLSPESLNGLFINYASSDKSVATVSADGTITAKGNGTATITVSSAGKIAKVKVTVEREGGYVVVLDPGHDSSHNGDHTGRFAEEILNLKVAQYCKEYLESHYSGVTVYMTRTGAGPLKADRTDCLHARTDLAGALGANIFVSFHFNALNGNARGAEVLISQYYTVKEETEKLGQCILNELLKVEVNGSRLPSRGLIPRKTEQNECDENGIPLDYYSVIRSSAVQGIPGVIIEHCFMDNTQDQQFLNSEEKLKNLGIADAKGIATYLGL